MTASPEPEIDGDTLVNDKTIAHLLGLSLVEVYDLAREGVLPKAGAGKYKLEGIRNYCIKRRTTSANAGERVARERLTQARAEIEETKQKLLTGEVVSAEEVASTWAAIVNAIRTRFLALPSRCAPRLMQASSAAEMAEIIREEVYAILEYLARAGLAATSFKRRARKRGGINLPSTGTAAQTDA